MHGEVWLYGPLARYSGRDGNIFAQVTPDLSEGSTVGDLLAQLGLPTGERGSTFINGNLSHLRRQQPLRL